MTDNLSGDRSHLESALSPRDHARRCLRR